MNFSIEWLTFYLLEQSESDTNHKRVTLSKMLTQYEYERSELKEFLDGEFTKIAKRKAEVNPKSDGTPTKIGQFIVEAGHPLDSNPTYECSSGCFKRRRQNPSNLLPRSFSIYICVLHK